MKKENELYLTSQLITYIGNKRNLLDYIDNEIKYIKKELNKEKLVTADLFSGSGVVSRLLKQHSSLIIANDLEDYAKVINECYLSNKCDFNLSYFKEKLAEINKLIKEKPISGILTKEYSPKSTTNIKMNERVFYSHENAQYIDSFRYYVDKVVCDDYKKYFIAPLLVEASIHVNTCGVFKGFYKDANTGIGKFGGTAGNALIRILGNINIQPPVLSNFESEYRIYQKDAVELSKELKGLDLVYLDPPYNQHPYGSNYFMLNLILKNKIDTDISKVSGIPSNWHRSAFNKKADALKSLDTIIKNIDSKFLLISYNNEGFISFDEMVDTLIKYGKVKTITINYNTFRGSRNLRQRDIHTNEYMFLLRKVGN